MVDFWALNMYLDYYFEQRKAEATDHLDSLAKLLDDIHYYLGEGSPTFEDDKKNMTRAQLDALERVAEFRRKDYIPNILELVCGFKRWECDDEEDC